MPFGVPLHKASRFFKINEQPGSKVEEPEDGAGATLAQTSALLSFRVHASGEMCSDLRFV